MATDLGSDELNDTAGGEHNRLKTLGKYRIQKRIGAGGMGTVFLAFDDSLNRTVALKVLPKDRAENPVLVRRFKAEGQAAAYLEHANIVRVFEAGEADGFLYMALEYVEGIDVHELVERRGVIPVKRSTDIIRQTTLALQHAHEKGIVHRDIKPSNLLIKRDGTVKLADLGLARSIDDTLETNITRAGTTVGTVDYMAPEQARNSKASDFRSDIYSLGCTWYHMLTGHPPFPEGSMTNKLQAHAVSRRPDPRAENERIPEGIVAIIQRMMASNPDDRYQNPTDLLEDLETTGKMHRGVDESVLAALASEAMDEALDEEEAVEVHEPELRGVGDLEDVDLAALKESGEHPAQESARSQKPGKSRRKKERRRAARRQERAQATPPGEAESKPPLEFKKGKRRQKEPAQPKPSQAPQRKHEKSADDDRDEPTTRKQTPWKKSPEKQTRETSKPAPGQSTKRGSVTTTGGQAPALPEKMTSVPVDTSSKKSINLDALKYLVPAVLVVGALGAVGFAIIRSTDVFNSPGGANPYVDGSKEQEGAPEVVQSPSEDEPSEDALNKDPSPEAPPRVDAIPFPGAENASQTDGGFSLVPDWVNAFRTPRKSSERSLVVRRRPLGNDEIAGLDEAVSSLPSRGGTILLAGKGPFQLSPTRLVDRGRVRIQAAEGHRPVVHLLSDENWENEPFVQLTRTRLELEGVHFVLAEGGAAGAVIFAVRDESISVRDCSLTVAHRRPVRLTGFQITGRPSRMGNAETGKCLLENVVIRGEELTAISLIGPTTDLVAGNCLFVSGAAPVVTVTDRKPGKTKSSAGEQEPGGIRLLATTALSAGPAIELVGGDKTSSVSECNIITRMTVLAASSPTSAMVALQNWPVTEGELGGQRAAGLSWSAERCAFVGWDRLLSWVDSQGEPRLELEPAPDAWREFWNQPLRTGTVIAENMSNLGPAEATPDQLHSQLAVLMPTETEGPAPGCRPAEFDRLPLGLMQQIIAVARQPETPDWLGEGMTIQGEPFRFDLSTRRSLSRYLASNACADGSHVIAFGSGVKEVEPFVISGKSVRLELESTGDTPLVLQPKPGRDEESTPAEWITVRNGTLDLVNARLRVPPRSRTHVYPHSAILLDDASLSLRNSTVEGPLLKADDAAPLIRWIGEGEARQDRAVFIENSFLVGLSSLLSGPVSWQSLIVRNSALASGADAITVTAESPEQLPAALLLDHCTIAADGAAIRVQTTPSATTSDPLTVYSRACVYAGPVSDNPQGNRSAVLAHSAGAAENNAVVWWGSANGFSHRLAGYRIDGPGSPGDFQNGWLSGWGEGHEANPLTGQAEVVFNSSIIDLKLIQPESFQLLEAAAASSWGPQGEPIGVSVENLGPRQGQASSSSTGSKTGEKSTGRSGRNVPGF